MKHLTVMELAYKDDASHYFEHFVHLPYSCFFDSSVFDGQKAHCKTTASRYDIMTAEPARHYTVTADGELVIRDRIAGTKSTCVEHKPLARLTADLQAMSPVDSQGLPFTGGIAGFWGYELCEQFECIPHRGTGTPHMSVGLYHWAVIIDHQERRASLVFHPDIHAPLQERILNLLANTLESSGSDHFQLLAPFAPTQSQSEYQQAFERIQQYISDGDCYEVNLTQRFTAPFCGCSWEAYRHLRTVTRAPYSAYLGHPDFAILSHSPEQFIRLRDGKVATNPIKGTRPRGATAAEDQAIARELQHCQKDRAENLMIVDLLRNDLGKVCKIGTVSVPRLFALESYTNVHHLVSTVTGELADEHDAFDLLVSTFPGGSITGAPKIRAMEIIRELEPVARSVYCGSVGYISADGTMDTSITIRTILAKDGEMHCWGGGAIVADSDCESEYQESITKVSNLMTALESYLCTEEVPSSNQEKEVLRPLSDMS